MLGLVLSVALLAPPPVILDPRWSSSGELYRLLEAHWHALEDSFVSATGAAPPGLEGSLHIRQAFTLPPGQSGASTPGRIELRAPSTSTLDPAFLTAARHELAHQFLWASCPAAARDRLFHEAYAVATSGELSSWTDDGYLSAPVARATLAAAGSLDTRSARRALARLLSDVGQRHGLPPALVGRLRLCAAGADWRPFTIDELTAADALAVVDAFVVVSRHSGEVVHRDGAVELPMPVGSILKPLLLAGARTTPRLPRGEGIEWVCGDGLGEEVDARTALLRSCNGWFLAWAAAAPEAASFGALGPLVRALGISTPADMSAAIGLRSTVLASPLQIAQAYRALAEVRPDVVALMRDNAREGTLAELDASPLLMRLATKTGTVRDARAAVVAGWLAAIDADHVYVMTRRGVMPRAFAGRFADAVDAHVGKKSATRAAVQVFALLPPASVTARCAGVALRADGAVLSAHDATPLVELTAAGRALCLGAPWRVSFPGLAGPPREYAGAFEFRGHITDFRTGSRAVPSRGENRVVSPNFHSVSSEFAARRGSEIVFETTLGRYAAGVLAAEDVTITGAARAALLQVVAHNVGQERHAGRPLCDTTHCQVFQGTRAATPADVATLDQARALRSGWLHFSRGGDEPWQSWRSRAEIESALGAGARDLVFAGTTLRFWRTTQAGADIYDERVQLGCEHLRAPLRLPSCPHQARVDGDGYAFLGRGAGHGLGMDVEWAKASGLSARRILELAYGDTMRGK